ncbi:MAG: glycerate 2-kinase [Phycisphaerales bacterium]|jgi:glycerate 2-kinase
MDRERALFWRGVAEEIMRVAIASADPAVRVRECWPKELNDADRVAVLAVGKAAVAMGNEAFEHLGQRLTQGVVVCPAAHTSRVRGPGNRVRTLGADHPIPTERNLKAAGAVAELASGLVEGDRLLVLLSGGASAYLCSPADGIGLDDLQQVTRRLLASGATIDELNTVRKHLEVLKGGGLARLVWPAASTVLVLSDVPGDPDIPGDPLDVIGSGPMTPDPTTFDDAIGVLQRHRLLGHCPAIDKRLRLGAAGGLDETPKPGDPGVARVRTAIIGNNSMAIDGVCDRLTAMGLEVVERRGRVRGEAASVGRALADRVRGLEPGRAVVWGGETTVSVGEAKGRGGRGGPCQELALAAALGLSGLSDAGDGLGVVAVSTDGVDGPTEAAGAWAGPGVVEAMRARGMDAAGLLRAHDSHAAFAAITGDQAGGGLLVTGATGTNVNDVYVGLWA